MTTLCECGQWMTELRVDVDLTEPQRHLYWLTKRIGRPPQLAPANVAICEPCQRAIVLGAPPAPVERDSRSVIVGLFFDHTRRVSS
jgi:hypothetical protein